MKKLLTIAIMTAAVSALAVESSNTFGILRVTIPAGQESTIIAAPWIDAGTDGEKIKVKDLIKTANLVDGDQIYVFDGSSYSKAFQLDQGVWKGMQIQNGGATISAGLDTDTITRGQAVVLKFATPLAVGKDIYLYGQYKAGNGTITLAKGTMDSAAYSLVAPSKTSDTNVNDDCTWENVGFNDYMIVPDKGLVTFKSGEGWGVSTTQKVNNRWTTVHDTTNVVIPAGAGVWFVSRSGTNPTCVVK